jgi:hypothetical protein
MNRIGTTRTTTTPLEPHHHHVIITITIVEFAAFFVEFFGFRDENLVFMSVGIAINLVYLIFRIEIPHSLRYLPSCVHST